jgi:hypothetical protein
LLEPGWYRDPTARFEARYWDGGHWTSHISHYGATGSDPLLAARFDRAWIRWTARLFGWALVIGLAWWGVVRFWPSDERDLVAEQASLDMTSMVATDLPNPYRQPAPGFVSPLWIDAESESMPEECETLKGDIVELADEPRVGSGYSTAAGDFISNSTVFLDSSAAAESYLDSLRGDDAGECLAVLWAALARSDSGLSPAASVRAIGDPSFGDSALWWRMELDDDGRTPSFADVVVVRVGPIASQYTFSGVGEATGVSVQRDVIVPHLERLAAALEDLEEGESADGSGSGSDG